MDIGWGKRWGKRSKVFVNEMLLMMQYIPPNILDDLLSCWHPDLLMRPSKNSRQPYPTELTIGSEVLEFQFAENAARPRMRRWLQHSGQKEAG